MADKNSSMGSQDWYTTPDMGEYMSTRMHLDLANNTSGATDSNNKDVAYFIEAPIGLQNGYYPDENVLIVSGKPSFMKNSEAKKYQLATNTFDGDTIFFNLDDIVDDNKSFSPIFTEDVFRSNVDYLSRTLRIGLNGEPANGKDTNNKEIHDSWNEAGIVNSITGISNVFSMRLVGINAPEIVKINKIPIKVLRETYVKGTLQDVLSGNFKIKKNKNIFGTNSDNIEKFNDIKINANKVMYAKIDYALADGNHRKIVEKDMNKERYFTISKTKDKENGTEYIMLNELIVPKEYETKNFLEKIEEGARIPGHENLNLFSSLTDDGAREVLICRSCSGKLNDVAYFEAGERAQAILMEEIEKAEDIKFMLDCNTLSSKTGELPPAYRSEGYKLGDSPLYVLEYLANIFSEKQKAYKYLGYGYFGQDNHRRILGSCYIKIEGQWRNLAKYLAYRIPEIEKAPSFTSSPEDSSQDDYISPAFNVGSYDNTKLTYIDLIRKGDKTDDRKEIQEKICGANIKALRSHTVMIGDCLLMVPPTSIRLVSQTKAMRTQFIRTKGSLSKELPKTERVIEMNLFFNNEGINGIEYTQKTPNGKELKYHMNGLRALISQFKFTPFLPVENDYINDVLGIEAVALSSYNISTVPNYPRTMQVTLILKEFEYSQYMPQVSAPSAEENEELNTNSFSKTIYFPVMRYYYQRALIKGGEIKGLDFNSSEYIKETIGQRTALQPIDFKNPTMDIYVMNESQLMMRKNVLKQLEKKPLGVVPEFTKKELEFLKDLCNSVRTAVTILNKSETATDDGAKGLFGSLFGQADHNTPDKGNKVIIKMLHAGQDFYDTWFEHSVFSQCNMNTPVPMLVNEKGWKYMSRESSYDSYIKPVIDNVNKIQVTEGFRSNLFSKVGFAMINEADTEGVFTKERFKTKWGIKLTPKWSECGSSPAEIINKLRLLVAKDTEETTSTYFVDDDIFIFYDSYCTSNSKLANNNNFVFTKDFGFNSGENTDMYAINLISTALGIHGDNDDSPPIIVTPDGTTEEVKDNVDIETEHSITFDKFYIGNAIITGMSTSYNNIFANLSLKAMGGTAPQFTGGSDSMITINMVTKDENTVRQFQTLNRKIIDDLITYRKVIASSPVRIDTEFTRLIGTAEVLIESIDINTVPNHPGLYQIDLMLMSVDRTVRNKEALQKIDVNESIQTPNNKSTHANRTYFDLENTLSKVEMYPDLELPPVQELENYGFVHLGYRLDKQRVFPNPDFYFVYLEALASELYRTAIVEFFKDYENNLESTLLASDLLKDEATISPIFNNGKGINRNLYTAKVDTSSDDKIKKAYQSSSISSPRYIHATESQKMLKDEATKVTDYYNSLNYLQETMNYALGTSHEVLPLMRIGLNERGAFSHITSDVLFKEGINYYDIDKNGYATDYKYGVVEDVSQKRNESLAGLILNILRKPISPSGKAFSENEYKDFFKYFGECFGADESQLKRLLSVNEYEIVRTVNSTDDFSLSDGWKEFLYGDRLNTIGITDLTRSVIRAVMCGASADEIYSLASDEDNMKQMPMFHIEHENKKYPRILKQAAEQDYQGGYPAITEEDLKVANEWGAGGIKLKSSNFLNKFWKVNLVSDTGGLIDPFYNFELSKLILKNDYVTEAEIKARIDMYTANISEISGGERPVAKNMDYLEEAIFRLMLCNMYRLVTSETGGLLPTSGILMGMLTDNKLAQIHQHIDSNSDTFWNSKVRMFLTKFLYTDEEEANFENTLEDKKAVAQLLKKALEDVKPALKHARRDLIFGTLMLLGTLHLEEGNSGVYNGLISGNIGQVANYYNKIKDATLSFENFSDTDMKITKMLAYLENGIVTGDRVSVILMDEVKKSREQTAKFGQNSIYQKIYISAADDPKIWLLHSFYDMVTKNQRGSMMRAFPTYYMLLIDEGRDFGAWHLQDNFYNVSAISDFQVVRSRKIAADTATINMSNLFGTYTTDDENIKAVQTHTIRDVWNSIFSPQDYMSKEYVRRKDAPVMNRAKLKPGARIHLRMGYSGNASELPIVFNGVLSEVQEGEVMTLLCQGDGVQLDNPGMFIASDANDTADLKNSDSFVAMVTNIFKNLSTPKGILLGPLVSEGGFIRSLIKDWSHSRFFSENPFGITHFGSKHFTDIFSNGEIEQNIYESQSRPTWVESGAPKGIVEEYELIGPPKIRMPINSGTTYWHLMHTAASISPDFIASIDNFGTRSTIFFGMPHYYYCYEYIKDSNEKVIEKRKPYQQYHLITSHSDIIENKMRATDKEIRTCAVGHYKGPGVIKAKDKTVGPLWIDIDIFPEYQKSTAVDCSFQYKSWDYVPMTIPIIDYIDDEWSDEGGNKIAWRATARALQESVKDMYSGEIIIMGDTTIKPYDLIQIYDIYEDVSGCVEAETVVHSFNTTTGFTTSITPDCRASIDNKYTERINSTFTQAILPVAAAHGALCLYNYAFRSTTKGLLLSTTHTAVAMGAGANAIINMIGKTINSEQLAGFAGLAEKNTAGVGQMLGLTELDYKVDNQIKRIDKAFKSLSSKIEVSSHTSFKKAINNFTKTPQNIKNLDVSELAQSIDEAIQNTDVTPGSASGKELLSARDNLSKHTQSYNNVVSASSDMKFEKTYLDDLVTEIKKNPNLDADTLKSLENITEAVKDGDVLLKSPKAINLGDDIVKVVSKVEDLSTPAISNLLKSMASQTDEVIKAADTFKDVSKIYGGLSAVSLGKLSFKKVLLLNFALIIGEFVMMKSAKEYIERKLKNLQVLTIYPVIKNDRVWTAGLNGSKGLVYGCPSYEERGFVDKIAEHLLVEGDDLFSDVLQFFFRTEEIIKTINTFKRDTGFGYDNSTNTQTAITEMMGKVMSQEVHAVEEFKKLFYVPRANTPEELNASYRLHQIKGYTDINSLVVSDYKLKYIYDDEFLASMAGKGFDVEYGSTGIDDRVWDNNREQPGDTIRMKHEKGKGVWDIPYLKQSACNTLSLIVEDYIGRVQPDYDLSSCDFKKIKKNGIYVTNATRINDNSWNSTGYQFTLQSNKADILGNVLSELVEKQEELRKTSLSGTLAIGYKKSDKEKNLYQVIVYPEK